MRVPPNRTWFLQQQGQRQQGQRQQGQRQQHVMKHAMEDISTT
jgi:hypothetical protein